MLRNLLLACALLIPATRASAQWQEGFDGGSNEGSWEIWWNQHNQVWAGGGNPDFYLRLDNPSTLLTCHFLEIFPTVWPAGFSGDWRAAGVESVGLDVNILQGPAYGQPADWTIRIAKDTGVAGDTADDCYVEFVVSELPPQFPGWQAFDFAVPSSSPTLPLGWTFGGSCGLTPDAVWNAVITDVDYWRVKMDTDPNAFRLFWDWDMGVDNLRVSTTLPTGYCFGDGTATACPCGNAGAAGEGCANSTGSGGTLVPGGNVSAAADALTLTAGQLPAGQPALLFSGLNAVNGGAGVIFGDGLRCAGGGVVRLGVQAAGPGGQASWGPGLGASGGWSAGDLRHFQGWYRDPAGTPCGAAFNLTHGVAATFTP